MLNHLGSIFFSFLISSPLIMEKDTKKLELITVSTPWDFDDVTVPAGVHSINNADVYEDDLGKYVHVLLNLDLHFSRGRH